MLRSPIVLLLLLSVACSSNPEPVPVQPECTATADLLPADAIDRCWRPALGDAGPALPDRLIEARTPGCLKPETGEDLEAWVQEARQRAIEALRLQPRRPVRTHEIQRTVTRDSYSIDVGWVEIFDRMRMPINLYLPADASDKSAPLVVTPLACGASFWTFHARTLAANLASRGMAVLVTEGFCNNGSRAELPDNDPHLGYAGQLLGQPGPTLAYLQELISAVGWVTASYGIVDGGRIGVAGYSYGGGMAMHLAMVDPRIRSISVPATAVGAPCESEEPIASDIWIESSRDHPDHVWSPRLGLGPQPQNGQLAMLYPRFLHTTAGRKDWGAHPDRIGPAMAYAESLYRLAGLEERVAYRTDGGPHEYTTQRRLDSYRWLCGSLLGRPDCGATEPLRELREGQASADELSVDIGGTRSWADQLNEIVEGRRPDRTPVPIDAVRRAFPSLETSYHREAVWEIAAHGLRIRAQRIAGDPLSFPIFVFEKTDATVNPRRLLYLPERGTRLETDRILSWLDEYDTVVSIDYLGLGETKSDRLLPHTAARYLMHDDFSLPRVNVDLLQKIPGGDRMDLLGCGWASSLYALAALRLDPERFGVVSIQGLPDDELGRLISGRKIPDLLLQAGLFSELSGTALTVPLGAGELRRLANCDAR